MTDSNVDTSFDTLPNDVFDKLMNDAPPGAPIDVQGGVKPEDKVVPPKQEVTKPEDKIELPERTPEALQKELDAAVDDNTQVDTKDEISIADFLKTKAQGLIERGIWQDFEGIDDFEWTEENYGKLAETQAEWKADEKYADKVNKVGDIGKIIIDHIEQGGNPDDIIDLFKAAKRVETFDIKTAQGKESLVKEYYTKVVGWSDIKADKYIKGLIDSGEDKITEEANEAKEAMDKGIQAQIKQTQEAAKAEKLQKEAQAKAWESNIKKVIKDREDLDDSEKRELDDALLNYNVKLQDGRVVNKFMIKFMEMQADPQKYLDLVRFVTNPDKYKAKVDKKAATVEAKKTWDFVKGNKALSRNTGTSHSTLQEKGKGDLVVDYRTIKF